MSVHQIIFIFAFIVFVFTSQTDEGQISAESELAKKEQAYKAFMAQFRQFYAQAISNYSKSSTSEFEISETMKIIESESRKIFELNWIHSSFGLGKENSALFVKNGVYSIETQQPDKHNT